MKPNYTGFEGMLLVNKPTGMSSFKIVKIIRAITKVKKVGHAGTLDPFASGLLIIAIGKPFTQKLDQFMSLSKSYSATMIFGQSTTTLDTEGDITETSDTPLPDPTSITNTLQTFLGPQTQNVPQFSAKKVNGTPMYKLARQGKETPKRTTEVTIHNIKLINTEEGPPPTISFYTECSKGTYIRRLAYDIGKKLDSTGYLNKLRRDAIGPYTLETALNIDDLCEESIRHMRFFECPSPNNND